MSKDRNRDAETVLGNVDAGRRSALKRLVLAAGAVAAAVPLSSVLLKGEQPPAGPAGPGAGQGKGQGKGKGKGKGKGQNPSSEG